MAALTNTTLFTNQAAALLDGSERPTRSPSSLTGGTLKCLLATFTTTSTNAANDTFNLCYLPKGAVVARGNSYVSCVDPGTTLTLDIGTSSNPDVYADGIDLAAGKTVAFGSTLAGAEADLAFAATTDNTPVIVTIASAGTVTTGVVLYFTIAYWDFN
jgi:hypothetical protein